MAEPAILFHHRERRRGQINAIPREHALDLEAGSWTLEASATFLGAQTFHLNETAGSAIAFPFGPELVRTLGSQYIFEGFMRVVTMNVGAAPFAVKAVYVDAGPSTFEKDLSLALGVFTPFKIPFTLEAVGGDIKIITDDSAKDADFEINRLRVLPLWP